MPGCRAAGLLIALTLTSLHRHAPLADPDVAARAVGRALRDCTRRWPSLTWLHAPSAGAPR